MSLFRTHICHSVYGRGESLELLPYVGVIFYVSIHFLDLPLVLGPGLLWLYAHFGNCSGFNSLKIFIWYFLTEIETDESCK